MVICPALRMAFVWQMYIIHSFRFFEFSGVIYM